MYGTFFSVLSLAAVAAWVEHKNKVLNLLLTRPCLFLASAEEEKFKLERVLTE
jgi:hypothetical protein